MTTLPAVVTLADLPTGAPLTGTELLMAVQTAGGVGNSIQVTVSQIATTSLGTLPTGGATGQFLQKSSGTNFGAAWASIASNVLASTGLAQAGSTTVSLSLASTAGLSVLGVGGTGSAVPAPIVGTGAQVFVINDGGTAANFGQVNLGSSAAVKGVLPGGNYSSVNLAAGNVAGGVQGLLPGTSIATASIPGLQIATNAIGTTQLLTAPGLSVLAVQSSGTTSFSVVTGAAGQVLAVNPGATSVAFVGGAVLLNTISPNNVATAGDTTSFTSAFRTYMVTFENVVPANNLVALQMQIATSGTAFVSGGYVSIHNSISIANERSTTVILLSGLTATSSVGNGTTYGVNGFLKIFDPANATFRKHIVGQNAYLLGTTSGTANIVLGTQAAYFDGNSNAITGLQFSFSSGNIQTGTIRVYGLA